MTPKEWAIQAFETCDHGGMICMRCAEAAIRAAIEDDRSRRVSEAHPADVSFHSVREPADLAL